MRVFKGYVKIVLRNSAQLFMYVAITIFIVAAIQKSAEGSAVESGFEAVKTKVAVIDREGGPLAETIRSYMERTQNLVEIADDPQVLQEALFYRNITYAVIVPENAAAVLDGEDAAAAADEGCAATVPDDETTASDGKSAAFVMDGDDAVSGGENAAAASGGEGAITVPDGENAAAAPGGTAAVQTVQVPGSQAGYYLDAKINSLLNQIRVYRKSGFSMEEACAHALALSEIEPDVTLLDLNGNKGEVPPYNYFFHYLPYGILSGLIMGLSFVIMAFKRKEIRRRLYCSPVPLLAQNLAAVCCFAAVGLVIWTACMAAQAFMYGGGIFTSPNAGYYILNSLAIMLVAMSLAYLVGMTVNKGGALNGLNNVISLGLCFLGGIFVPIEMLNSKIINVSRFLPTYWYSRINGILRDYADVSPELTKVIFQGLLIQVLFALACFCATMAVTKARMRE